MSDGGTTRDLRTTTLNVYVREEMFASRPISRATAHGISGLIGYPASSCLECPRHSPNV
jgi:hypothetical protein